ncbi:MAG: rhombosortase [Rhodobacterales bacterium]|nr:MAG: rhombosortase [Rhodobacterales bacterium]
MPRYCISKQNSITVRMVISVIVLGGAIWLAELGGPARQQAWLLETGAVQHGQWWRLLSAHLVHLNRAHCQMNLLGLLSVMFILWPVLTAGQLLWAVSVSGLTIGLLWVLLQPPGPTYVGFSGVIHGVLLYGGLLMIQRGPGWFGGLIVAGITAKLSYEILFGPLPGVEHSIGGRVSMISHCFGALGGALAAVIAGIARPWCWLALGLCALAILPNLAFEKSLRHPEQVSGHATD